MKKIVGIMLFFAALTLSAQVVNESWRPDEGPVCYAVTILDYATMSPKELAIHYFTNLARMGYDCGTPSLECGASASLPLLSLDFKLSTAARWFSKHLNDTPCFQHDTCCNLILAGNAVTCDGDPICVNQPCGETHCAGTPWVERIAMFGGNPTAENIAAGNDTAAATICQWMNSPGHRDNICLGTNTSLGTGYYGGQNCFLQYWTQDFGGGSQTARLYPGALFFDGNLTAGIVVKSPSPVATAAVSINGAQTALANTFGTDTRGAWSALVTAADCAAYYFTVSFGDSKTERFPPSGYLFNSELPETCEAPDGEPDADTAVPDDTVSDDQTDGATDMDEQPDEAADDHTTPYDFNPHDEDHPIPDYGEVDWDVTWLDTDKPADTGCGCSVVF